MFSQSISDLNTLFRDKSAGTFLWKEEIEGVPDNSMEDTSHRRRNQKKSESTNGITVINFHMHKTGGTTRDRIFERQFPKEASFYFEGGNPEHAQKSMKLLQCLSEEEKLRIRYVWGGPFFGLHEYLPRSCTYVTFVRDPVERVVSEYYFALREKNHGAHNEVVSQNMTLEDYVKKGVWLAWNGQTRCLRGVAGGLPSFGHAGPVSLSTEDLEMAEKNLRKHFIVGITDRFDESLMLVKRAFGWKTRDVLYVSHKVDQKRPFRETISFETIKLIEEHNELDKKIYEFAKQMLEERISQQDASFKREIQIFRVFNRIYGIANKLFVTVISLVRGELTIRYIFNKIFKRSKAVI